MTKSAAITACASGFSHARKHLGWALDVAAAVQPRAGGDAEGLAAKDSDVGGSAPACTDRSQDAFDDFAWSAAA